MSPEHLKQLYERHSEAAFNYLKGISHDRDTALDLLQDTFLRVNEYFKEGKIKNERSWILGIARNVFLNYVKNIKEIATAEMPDRIDTQQNVSNEIQWKMLRESILQTLNAENPVYQEIFILRLDLNLSHEEIAETTRIPLRTIRRHFEKIRTILHREFKHDLEIKLDIS